MKWIYKALFLFITVWLISVVTLADTEIKGSGASILSILQERQMGQEFMQEVHRRYTIIQDPVVNTWLKQVGNRLVSAAPNKKYRRFRFFIIKDNTINAFAGPDGYIGVNSGLILATHSESELASVLAHEISHVTQNHLMRRMEEAKQQNITSLGAILASILIGSVTNSNIGSGAMMAALGNNVQQSLDFSRSHEQEADRIGIQTLYDAGYDPQAMPDFFKTMQQSSFTYKYQAPEFALTHPLTESRMADLKNRSSRFPRRKAASHLIYYLARERLRTETAPGGHNIVNYYQEMLASRRYDNKSAFEYGYVLALMKNHQYASAKQHLQSLMAKEPNQPVYTITFAQLELQANQTDAALNTLKTSVASNPNYYPLLIEYAEALLTAGHPRQARDRLRKIARKYPNDINALELLARAESKSGDIAEAYQAKAKIYTLSGNPKMAILQLQQAEKLPDLDQNTKLILEAKLSQLKKRLTS